MLLVHRFGGDWWAFSTALNVTLKDACSARACGPLGGMVAAGGPSGRKMPRPAHARNSAGGRR